MKNLNSLYNQAIAKQKELGALINSADDIFSKEVKNVELKKFLDSTLDSLKDGKKLDITEFKDNLKNITDAS